MATAVSCLEVIRLRGLNAAKAGAAALDINHQCRHIRTGNIAQTFSLQGNSGAGGGSHDTHTGSGSTVDHIDGCDFTFCLQEHAADLGHLLCHIGGNFCLGGDGVAEVMAAAGTNGGFCNGFVALH